MTTGRTIKSVILYFRLIFTELGFSLRQLSPLTFHPEVRTELDPLSGRGRTRVQSTWN